jgi:hypothetical protein
MNEHLKVGDVVLCRGGWGHEAPKKVTITHLELCVEPGDKYGVPVAELPWADKARAVVDMDNGHWAYGSQIDPVGVV